MLVGFLIICIVNFKTLAAQTVNNHDGLCPSFVVDILPTTVCQDKCSSDADCGFDEKCCQIGCLKSCFKAVITSNPLSPCAVVLCGPNSICEVDKITNQATCLAIRSGTCPLISPDTAGICIQECSNDKECSDDKLCCSNGCGNVCTKPCQFTTCRCPFGANYYLENGCKKCSCNTDPCLNTTCRVGYVCKYNAISNQAECVSTVHDGSCPILDSIGTCDKKCENDADCGLNEKCCSNGCGRVCTVVPIACPALACICPYEQNIYFENGCPKCNCTSDPCSLIVCPPNTVCQMDKILNKAACVPPSHDGYCPVTEIGVVGACIKECSTDSDCPSDKKCCSNGCGNVCKEPCQLVNCVCRYGFSTFIENGCKKCVCNSDPCLNITCKEGSICRFDIITYQTSCAPVVHDGSCPVLNANVTGTCIEGCYSDGDCALNEKCCSNGCGHVCTNVLTICPPIACICPYGRYVTYENGCPKCNCNTDPCLVTLCKTGYVCKYDPMNNQATCVAQVHDGSCPVLQNGTIGTCIEACSSDVDCLKNQKCCSNGCGHVCTDVNIQCPALECSCTYARNITYENGCPKCTCINDPCSTVLCAPGSICKVDAITLAANCISVPTPVDSSCPLPQCNCSYGINYYLENGCRKCSCETTDPCKSLTCQGKYTCKFDKSINKAACVLSVHSGLCPREQSISLLSCLRPMNFVSCLSDSDCGSNEKCCPNSCRRICTKSIKMCSFIPCNCLYGTTYIVENGCRKCVCIDPCQSIQCDRSSKCQVDSMTRKPVCVSSVKSGKCPSSTLQICSLIMLSIFKHKCDTDADCIGEQKCCLNSCLRTCTQPCVDDVKECNCHVGIPTLVENTASKCKVCSCENPCENTKCESGTTCVVKEVTCIRSPCRPIAQCVPNLCSIGNQIPNMVCSNNPDGFKCPTDYNCSITSTSTACCPLKDLCENVCDSTQRCALEYTPCESPPCSVISLCLPGCQKLQCNKKTCTDGYAFDINGCQTCECFKQ